MQLVAILFLKEFNEMNEDKKLRLREFLIKEKLFLKSLFLGNPLSNRTSLSFATKFQLNLLIRVLFYIVRGEIPLKKKHYENLTKSRKRRLLHSKLSSIKKLNEVIFLCFFNSLFIKNINQKQLFSIFLQINRSSREEKIKFLNNFLSLFSSLLYLIFNEK